MPESVKSYIRIFPDLLSINEEIAGILKIFSKGAINHYSLALSGGNTPRSLYQLLAEKYQDIIRWDKIDFFWGDERYVPIENPDSNFGMAYQELLSKIRVPKKNIYRIPVEEKTPEKAAEKYEIILKKYFSSRKKKSIYTFDLVLLGVGNDGHTASLFPNNPILEEKEKWVGVVQAPGYILPRTRITLTLPVINSAKRIIMIVSGKQKRGIIEKILNDKDNTGYQYPVSRVHALKKTEWYVDQKAFGKVL